MSFFGALLGGAMSGVGAGMASMGADEDRLAQQRALIQERSQAALDLQRQRADDKLYQQEQLLQMKSELGGGGGAGGGGGKGLNLAALAMQAKTPEEQQRVINLARTFGGDDAGALLAEQMFGQAKTTGVAATPGDFARYDRAGDMEAPPPTSTVERAAYDADKGRQALQRLYALALDPAKTDDFAKAERQFGLNDFGAANASQVIQRGGSLPEASTAFQKYSSSVDDSEKNRLRQEAIDASRDRTASTAASSADRNASAEAGRMERQIADTYKELNKARPKDKPAIQERIEKLEARRDAMDSGAPSTTPKRVTTPATTVSPASRAAAWKSKFGAAQ